MIRRAVLLAAALLALAVPSAHAAFPGQNGKIAFTSSADGDSEIYTINPDGSGLAQLTYNTVGDFSPAWSPDGQRIAFERLDGSDRDIWLMNANGSGQVRILEGVIDVEPRQPTWSPDGLRIALSVFGSQPECDNQPSPGIYTMDADGSNLAFFDCQAEVGGGDGAFDPAWSPDGVDISFAGGAPDSGELYSKPAAGGTTVNLTQTGDHWEFEPDWSPNGTRIAYRTELFAPSGDYGVRVMNRDGSAQMTLREGGNPHWAPDATRIAFTSQGPPAGIWTMEPDGTAPVFLTSGSAPAWQPLPINYYARPKGATPILASLVTAYKPCSSPDSTHGPPLAFGSCSSPQMASDHLTVGTGDSNGKPARSEGEVRIQAILGNPANPADEADVAMGFLMNDIYTKAMVDYDGELRVRLTIQVTDKNNTPHPSAPGGAGAATTTEIPIEMVALCSPTINIPDEGSYCSISTSADTLAPGSVREGRRTIWQVQDIEVYDGGADGDADTPSGDTLFATKGLFIP